MSPAIAVAPEARFWAKVDSSGGLLACWPWMGTRIWSGYGQFREGGRGSRMVGAHRFSFALANGLAPDAVRHTCDNPPCVNPLHLVAGDHRSNMADMRERGRASRHGGTAKGERHGRALVTEVQVREVRRRAAAGEAQAHLARELGVTESLVSRLVRRTTWGHIQ